MARDYGLGVRTGIDLPGETAGRIPDRAWKQQNWDDTKVDTCVRAKSGYPDVAGADPARAIYLKALAVENGGTLCTPQVTAASATPDGTLVRAIEPKASGQVGLSPRMLAFLHSARRGVVTDGTAKAAFVGFPLASYPVAGKTGTAEVFGKQTTLWFVSYAPANRPKYAVVVVVSQAGTGAETSAPVVRQIYDAIRSQP